MSAAMSAPAATTAALRVRSDLGLATIEAEWTALCGELGLGYNCYPEWLRAWRRCFDDAPLHLVTAHRGDRLVGVLPLVRRRGVLTGATDRFPAPAAEPVAVDVDVLAALFRGVEGATPRALRWNALTLPAGSEDTVRAAIGAVLPRVRLEVQAHNPVIDLTRSWADQQQHIGRSHRRDIGRRRRRAEELGRLTHETWRDASLPPSLFEECLRVEASGWKGRQGTAITCQPAQLAYYRWLTTWFAEQGWLRFEVLRLDDRVLAFELNAVCGATFHMLKVGYEDTMRHLTPGLILQNEVMRGAFEEPGVRRAELGTGVTPLKERWATSLEPRYRLRASPDDARGRLRDAGTRASEQARTRIVEALDDDRAEQLRRARARVQRGRGRGRGRGSG
jgi:CelD/BcsL family acetyltransferase involved in cellulose biosynthesis